MMNVKNPVRLMIIGVLVGLIVMVLAAGCNWPEDNGGAIVHEDIYGTRVRRFVDREMHVACYISGNEMECVYIPGVLPVPKIEGRGQ